MGWACKNLSLPKQPPNRLIREEDGLPSELCPMCGSSMKRSWKFWRKHKGCIQPKCRNYESCDKTTEGN